MTLSESEPPARTRRSSPTVERLGPDSLTWRYFGDLRCHLAGARGGILQLLHPAIGAGVAQHSSFFEDPLVRIERSVPPILGVIYDEDPLATARQIRGFHTHIKGNDEKGRPYHALRRQTFWWGHATIFELFLRGTDLFVGRLRAEDKERLYQESLVWWRLYGMGDVGVPPDRPSFRRRFYEVCRDELEMTAAAARALEIAQSDGAPMPTWVPGALRPVARPGMRHLGRLFSVGTLPRAVRTRFGVRWTVRDELELQAVALELRTAGRFIPASARLHPRAAAGWRRIADEAAA